MSRWIELDGTVNTRDLGGLPRPGGAITAYGVVLRSDNLQDLSTDDVARLVDELGLTTVVDLRTPVEIEGEGPGPLRERPEVAHVELDLIPDYDPTQPRRDIVEQAVPDEEQWRGRLAEFYLSYLRDRPDNVVAALRAITDSKGAVLVHCAAGKDRTGVVCALALSLVGVPAEVIVDDYVETAERVPAIRERLTASPTYAADLEHRTVDDMLPHAESMRRFLEQVPGGVQEWARAHGFGDEDVAALRSRLTA